MSTRWIVTVLMAIGSLIFTQPASAGPAVMCPAGTDNHITADAVVCWNEITGDLVAVHKASPQPENCEVHGAIHDAVQAYEHRFEPYAIDIASGTGSPSAAVAKAAPDILAAVFSSQLALSTPDTRTSWA